MAAIDQSDPTKPSSSVLAVSTDPPGMGAGSDAETSGRAPSVPVDQDSWRQYLGAFLSSEDVQARLGGVTSQHIAKLVEQKRLLALPTTAGPAYPAFQFSSDGRVYPAIAKVIRLLDDVVVTPYTIASWLKSPKEDLGGLTPLRWLELKRDSRRVVEAARRTAAQLAR